MFADIFADKSDNFLLDPRRYIRRHDICNIGIFVSYNETSKAFWIYLPTQRKVVVRREVKFKEEKSFRRSLNSKMEDQHGTT